MNPFLAARFPLEVLDHVGHVNARAIDAGLLETLIEQSSRRADERSSLMIFLIAWLLADEEKIGGHRTLAEDRLRRAPPERAGAARGRRAAQRSVTSLGGGHGTHDVSLMSVVTSMDRANEGMR